MQSEERDGGKQTVPCGAAVAARRAARKKVRRRVRE